MNDLFRKHVDLQTIEKSNFQGQHEKYLRSPQWRAKREKVMARAKGICEGCGERRPTQVHHLNYAHWMDELLFELVAVCDECHHKCHVDEGEMADIAVEEAQ